MSDGDSVLGIGSYKGLEVRGVDIFILSLSKEVKSLPISLGLLVYI